MTVQQVFIRLNETAPAYQQCFSTQHCYDWCSSEIIRFGYQPFSFLWVATLLLVAGILSFYVSDRPLLPVSFMLSAIITIGLYMIAVVFFHDASIVVR